MTADKGLQFQICLSDADTEAVTWSLSDTERITNQVQREISSITWNGQKKLKVEFSIHWIKFEAWWETIGIQAIRKTIAQCILYFRYPNIPLVSHISESIQPMGYSDNITTEISEWLHIANMNESYRSSNKVNYIRQVLKLNDQCTGLDYLEETLSYLALQGWHGNNSANVFNQLSTTVAKRSTRWAHLLHLQTKQEEPIIYPQSQQVYHLRETNVRRVCRRIKLTSLRDASEEVGIPIIGQLFPAQIGKNWGYQVSGLVLRYDQNVLIDCILIMLQNGLLYYRQPFYYPSSVKCLGLHCKVVYTNANQWIMAAAHNIWVQYKQSEENNLDNTFQGRIPSFRETYFSWPRLNRILHFQKHLLAGKPITTVSMRWQKTQQWVLPPQVQAYRVVIRTTFNDLPGWAECIDGFIWVVKLTNMMHIVPVGAMIQQAHVLRRNAAAGSINNRLLVNNHIELDTYWTVY